MKLLLVVSVFFNIFFLVTNYERSVVVSVPDGDSLQLSDGRRIRLLGIDAPERGRCMADEARTTLETIAKSRHVRLKNTVTDDYGRTLANVIVEELGSWLSYLLRYTSGVSQGDSPDVFVNRAMVSRGLAKYSSQNTQYHDTLKDASIRAKDQLLGIYAPSCRSTDPTSPDCVIKGNLRGGVKTYHLPACDNYDQTIIDTSFGDRWFCSEKEAVAAGYKKASGCTSLNQPAD